MILFLNYIEDENWMKKVDVIIPAYKPGKEFSELIKRLEKQTLRPDRIIVMNTGKEFWDEAVESISSLLEVYHIEKKEFDHGGTRREAAKKSQADIIMFMTQDALPADSYLIENLVKKISKEDAIGAAYARQLPKADCRYLEKYTRAFNYPEESSVKRYEDIEKFGIKTFFCSNVCAAYDREIYTEVGGFVEKAIFNEDMIYAGNMVKKGYGIAYMADACVYHSHNYSCIQQMHRNFDLGVSQAEHPEIFSGLPSEGEGIKLVKRSIVHLLRSGHFWYIPELIFQSGFKYLGYLAGKKYKKLPGKIVAYMTMNPGYWEK